MASNSNSTVNSSSNHAPATPSGLRQSYTASSSDTSLSPEYMRSSASQEPSESESSFSLPRRPINPDRLPSETTGLLSDALYRDHAHEGPCDHGTFSPRPASPSTSFGRPLNSQNDSRAPSPGASSESSLPIIDSVVAFVSAKGASDWKKRWARKMRSKTMSTSSELAERHGVKDNAFMYVPVYFWWMCWYLQQVAPTSSD